MKTSSSTQRGHRLWWPIGVVLLAVIGLVITWRQAELEQMFKGWITTGISLLVILFLLFWLVFLSRFPWKARLITVALLGLSGFLCISMLRLDGTVNGTGMPRLVWKWAVPEAAQVVSNSIQTTNFTPSTVASDIPDVPQFFGATRDGMVRNVQLETDWNAAPPKELWRQPIGLGWSGFAVVNGRAFTQEQRGDDELVTCYELLTGRLLWAHTNHVRFSQWQGGDGPRATPALVDGHVFTHGGTGLLNCLKADTGELVWSRDVLAENHLPNLVWGVSSSPLVYADTVVVTGGLTNGPTLLAYDRQTGKPLWQAGTDIASYASPVFAHLAGRDVVLSVNAGSFTAHDPATGKELLNYTWAGDKFPKASQPIVLDGDRVFLSAGYGVGCALLEIKATQDGNLTIEEVWKNKMMKTQFSSALAREGFIYGLDDGLLACIELANGKRKWKDGRYGFGQTLLVGDVVLVQSEPGPVVLVEANHKGFNELARLPALDSKTWTIPTLAGRYLIVRNDQEVVCYELSVKSGSATAASL